MRKSNDDLQLELDIKKWLESEEKAKDLCGTYDFCAKCNKEPKIPCALAYRAYNKKNAKPIVPFKDKLNLAKDETKNKYNELTTYLHDNNYTLRMCKKNVTIRYNKILIATLTLTRNSLKAHLALDPTLYTEIPHLDFSDKKTYADTPFTIKLTSKKSIKVTQKLIDTIREAL